MPIATDPEAPKLGQGCCEHDTGHSLCSLPSRPWRAAPCLSTQQHPASPAHPPAAFLAPAAAAAAPLAGGAPLPAGAAGAAGAARCGQQGFMWVRTRVSSTPAAHDGDACRQLLLQARPLTHAAELSPQLLRKHLHITAACTSDSRPMLCPTTGTQQIGLWERPAVWHEQRQNMCCQQHPGYGCAWGTP